MLAVHCNFSLLPARKIQSLRPEKYNSVCYQYNEIQSVILPYAPITGTAIKGTTNIKVTNCCDYKY